MMVVDARQLALARYLLAQLAQLGFELYRDALGRYPQV